MKHLKWTEDLHVGLPSIDAQHKELFDMANSLVTAIEQGKGREVLKDIFNRLKDYTRFHFQEEEAYMLEVGYPEYDAHSAEHAILMVRANTLWRMIQTDEDISPEGTSIFLREWIANHIMREDVKIEKYSKSQA